MTDAEKVARCVDCRAEFTEAETKDQSACPTCGSKGTPSDPRKDVQITINPHELRILTIWAGFHADNQEGTMKLEMQKTVTAICSALKKQDALKGVGLSFADDVQEVADTLGTKAKIVRGDGEVVKEFEGKKPS